MNLGKEDESLSPFLLLKLSANALWDFAPQPQGKPPQCFSFLFHHSDFALLLEKGHRIFWLLHL